MRKIINFFKRLWRLICGKEIRPWTEPEVVGVKKPGALFSANSGYDIDIDYTDIYDTIERCKTVRELQKECKALGITINVDYAIPEDKTLREKASHLYELLKVYSQGVLQKYKSAVNAKLSDIRPLRDRRIKELRLQGLKYDSEIDYVDIYNCLLNCKTQAGLQKECKERGIYLNTEVINISPYKTIQLKCEELSSLLKTYANGSKEQYDKLLETKIEEFELLKNKRIEDLNAIGLCCPKCFSKQKKYYTGLMTWKTRQVDGGSGYRGAGIGCPAVHIQFHYKKCPKCGEWKMFEYREVPAWYEDLFDIDCPFKQGDMIEKVSEMWKSGKMEDAGLKYYGYEIIRW